MQQILSVYVNTSLLEALSASAPCSSYCDSSVLSAFSFHNKLRIRLTTSKERTILVCVFPVKMVASEFTLIEDNDFMKSFIFPVFFVTAENPFLSEMAKL